MAGQLLNSVRDLRIDGDGRAHVGNVIHNYHSTAPQVAKAEADLDTRCLADLRITDPRDDKKRIELTKGGLLKDSYLWVLENDTFKQWRDDGNNALLWIKGDPGKGKTMLLCGIIDELGAHDKGPLMSFFFCQATDKRINNSISVLRGLIYLLVKQEPLLKSHLRRRHDDAGKTLFEDANAWIALSDILVDILQDPKLPNTFLVIDALDECVDGMQLLLQFVAKQSSESSRVKWLVSSRNWPAIEEQLGAAPQQARLSLDLDQKSIRSAVSNYIRFKVEQLSREKKYDKRTQRAVQWYLFSNAYDTFLWVSLVCQQLAQTPKRKVMEKLTPTSFPPGLDSFYQRMVDQVHGSDDADLCKRTIAVALAVYRPMTLDELTPFVDLPDHDMDVDMDDMHLPIDDDLDGFSDACSETSGDEQLVEVIKHCGSFLTLRDRTVYFVHQSARDFLLDKSLGQLFPPGIEQLHHGIFSRSLQLLSGSLRRDMYSLGSLGKCVSEADRPDPDPLASARYSSVYWVDHLHDSKPRNRADDDLEDSGAVDGFLRRSFLHWLEALSLWESMPDGLLAMSKLESLVQGRKSQLADLVRDGYRFAQYNKRAIEGCPLQVYASALLFCPARSLTRNLFQHEEPRWIVTKPLVGYDWNACLQTLEGHSGSVKSVAWSHDAMLLASASADKTVKIWDSVTGHCVTTFEGHKDVVNSVAWSHQSTRVASASSDQKIKIWDPKTSQCVATLGGHTNRVNSAVWSRDMTRIVSASDDKEVRVWDLGTGSCISALKGHSDWVRSVAWSHDSTRLASASYDQTVKIWRWEVGDSIATLKGHGEWINMVAWSHCGGMLVTASDDNTIKTWNSATGLCLSTIVHNSRVNAVAWSCDDGRIASASDDNMVMVWDAARGQVHSVLQGHSSWVFSLAWSHDATRIASASDDKTIKIWDPTAGRFESTVLQTDTSRINSMAWSCDGTRVASASNDMLKIWASATGLCIATLDLRHRVEQIERAVQRIYYVEFDKSNPSRLHTNMGKFDLDVAADSSPGRVVDSDAEPWSIQDEAYGLSEDGAWIAYKRQNLLWLPPEYRPSASAIHRRAVAIGCSSGRVLIFRFSESTPAFVP